MALRRGVFRVSRSNLARWPNIGIYSRRQRDAPWRTCDGQQQAVREDGGGNRSRDPGDTQGAGDPHREAGKVVREAIRQVLARPGSESLSARQVRALLRVDPLPSLRTVQWHLKAIRAT